MRDAELALALVPSMTWTLAEVIAATGGTVAYAADRSLTFDSIATDSRRLTPGALFIALIGETHDGHRFAADALAQGARAVLVQHVASEVPQPQAIVVPDTLRALGDLAAWTRRREQPLVIAITGSNGKTTTKEMAAAICDHASFPAPRTGVVKSIGTENNLIGVPLTLLRVTGSDAVAVVEMGMSVPGEIARLVEIAGPDVGVVTNIGPVHLAGCGSIEGVAAAKGELFAGMRRDATVAVNLDDERVVKIAAGFRGRRIEFGSGGEVHAAAITDCGLDGIAFDLGIGKQATRVRLRLPGRHNVENALAAAAVTHAIGVDLATIRAGLEAIAAPPKRMQVVKLANGATLLNDSYNANPANVEAALRVLVQQPGRAIAVLGEMRELGEASAAWHRQVGELAARLGVRLLIGVGEQAEALADGARAGGLDAAAVHVCADPAAAATSVAGLWRAGDVILIKGSRGAATEEVVRLRGSRMAEVVRLLQEAGGHA
ncbi:MAG: UDP-N-acetylmuramoyl-tripeptide--D-alanyl-D-alanine ligase [Deltaproteobacteria bacterium]|nr:UDP-N-acetylmuramoyl-tripeptide--D-alanyl-D-alanine ligase [Deltaproteobacteria bacterium]